jgi:hypothetical protein
MHIYRLVFERVTVSPQRFLGNDVSFFPSPSFNLPSLNAAASADRSLKKKIFTLNPTP